MRRTELADSYYRSNPVMKDMRQSLVRVKRSILTSAASVLISRLMVSVIVVVRVERFFSAMISDMVGRT